VPGSSHGQQARQPVDAPESSDKDQEQDQAINNPEDYATARKKLKKDFLEFYRGLELLNDYRVLNETGFHKALKKFDKVTKVRPWQASTETSSMPCRVFPADYIFVRR